ncbi:unnamed protein product [Durusdinium trenchii]|uniref:Uncharacterized protein n=2 Tax=Durusdinium trenchii TaxID=1381693 RepID=A0ABP0M4C1_9DINO
MQRSRTTLKVDPALVVQRRLPWQVRKNQLQQRLFDEDKVEDISSQTPSVVVQVSQATRRNNRDPQLWNNLLDQALASHAELAPQDMASILWSMGSARFHHKALVEEFVRTLSLRAGVKSLVTSMLALERLGLPTGSLRAPFLQHLSGQCHELSFGDLRRVLMALARCRKHGAAPQEQFQEICDAIHEKSVDCDPRDLIAIPQHLGRLQFVHSRLLACSTTAISRVISSRLAVLPLDVLRALDGLLLLVPLIESGHNEGVTSRNHSLQCALLVKKCGLLARRLLQNASLVDLWSIGSQLLGSDIAQVEVWSLWILEAAQRRKEQRPGESRSHCLRQLRRQMVTRWSLQSLPEDLELALQVRILTGPD